MNFETLVITQTDGVAHIELNRPDKANALNATMWKEMRLAFDWLSSADARVAVLSGRGKHFSAGIDLGLLTAIQAELSGLAEGRRQERLKAFIVELQQAISAAERCTKPILAAIHGACIGGAIDLITACDMRYAAKDTRFSVKEVDLAIVADVGTLQRLPRLIGDGLARELAFTGREFDANEAQSMKLVNHVCADKASLLDYALALATAIARKSPLTIRGIKDTLNYSRDHPVDDGLADVAAKNAATLFSSDLSEALAAAQQRRVAKFAD